MTRVLIDSSAWIHFFNRSSRRHHQAVLKLLHEDKGVICGPILTEIFRGARTEQEKRMLKEHFDWLEYLPLDREDFEAAAELGFRLARHGNTMKTVDLLIGHLAFKHRIPLLHDDKDFERLALDIPIQILIPE